MDDTHQSRTSDAAAAATRKRRSSILKSQRPPRTPFSDLEFNVATPTDTTKSRRVSFSKRTGVAEFATNEATTTWKNFYEEHNKSLELSGNDFGVNASKQPIGHIGKRIFDQQFEVEAIDISILNPSEHIINTSMNNVNFTQQIASLECTGDDRKLTAPQSNFELSTFTDHQSKVFLDDLAIPSMGEITDRIDVNFSDVQNIGANDDKDDLDEIQKDFERAQTSGACHRPSRNGREISEYIELKFDTTNVAMEYEESDMSITDTVHSPKVQDVSKNFSIDKKSNSSTSKDWVTDKENIAVNPYVAPRESANFAVNEEVDKVLVFDGKRLTIQSEKKNSKVNNKDNYRQKHLPDTPPEKTPQRKTIVLNVNDDLPNYVNSMQTSSIETSGTSVDKVRQSVIFNDIDLSMTQPLIGKIEQNPNSRTMVYDDDIGDISMTQAIPNNIILPEKTETNTDRRRTIVYENDTGNISVTQALPNIILPGNLEKPPERRKTIVYENETGNISITQAVPTHILFDNLKDIPERRKTILYDNDEGNVSITQAIPSQVIASDEAHKIPEKLRTIAYENYISNISITQAIPTNILLATNTDGNVLKVVNDPVKRKTIVFDDDSGDISITKAVPQNKLLSEKIETKRSTTILYDIENDVSITQAVPDNFMISDNRDSNKTVYDNDVGNISVTQAIPTNILLPENTNAPTHRRRTVVFEDDTANLSITQAVPKNHVIPGLADTCNDNDTSITDVQNTADTNKRKTIVYDNDNADISMTQAIPANIIFCDKAKSNEKRQTIVYEDNRADISITQAVPTDVFLFDGVAENSDSPEKKIDVSDVVSRQEPERQTIVFQDEDVSMSEVVSEKLTETISHNRKSITFNDINEISIEALPLNNVLEKSKTVVFTSENRNFSMSKPIPSTITSLQSDDVDKSIFKKNGLETNGINLDYIIYQTDTTHDVQKWQSKTINQSNFKNQDSIIEDNKAYHLVNNAIEPSESEESVKAVITGSQTQLVRCDLSKPEEIKNAITFEAAKSDKLVDSKFKSSPNEVVTVKDQTKHSILNELLDMSTGSLDGGLDSKKLMITMANPEKNAAKDTENTSSESLFFIARDSDEDGQMDKSVESKMDVRKSIKPKDDEKLILSPKSKSGIVAELKNKLIKLKSTISGGKYIIPSNRHYEKIFSSDLEKDRIKRKDKRITIQNANDTNELLDMLSELTDKSINIEEEGENLVVPIAVKERKCSENGNPKDAITAKEYNALESEICAKSFTLKENNALENKNAEDSIIVKRHNDLESEKSAESFTLKGHNALENEKHEEPSMVEGLKALEFNKAAEPITTEGHIAYETENRTEPLMAKGILALESKSAIIEPKRLSFAPNRQSIAISREDLMNNISMAQAALQLSRHDMDDSESIEDSVNDTTTEQYAPHKSIRMSNEVVKTLNFEEDDTASEISLKSYPLKKTKFGEISYIRESNTKVSPIPNYLKDVSDGIKELMDDLVKPMADVLPFESVGLDKTVKMVKSSCSMQIQANLITSSQIDVCNELTSESTINIKKMDSLASEIATLGNRAMTRALKSPIHGASKDTDRSSEIEIPRYKEQTSLQKWSPQNNTATPKKVLIFDHYNPLNNVLIGPIDTSQVHKYHPRISSDTINVPPRENSAQISVNEDDNCIEMERISHHYNVESRFSMKHSVQQAGDASSEKAADTQSIFSYDSKPMSMDQSIDVRVIDVKDNEVNTLITMKGNNELLDASSSLTLVDDMLARSTFDFKNDFRTISANKDQIDPVEVIYKTEMQEVASPEKQDTDGTSNDDSVKSQNCTKSKKRIYSPPKREKKLTFDLTPKPMSKMQKRSNSPIRTISPDNKHKLLAEKDATKLDKCIVDCKVQPNKEMSPESSKHIDKMKSPRKVKTSPKGKKGTTITVQQLITEYHIETNVDQKTLNKQILQALNNPKSGSSNGELNTMSQSDDESKSLEMVSSFASSKNAMPANPSFTSTEPTSDSSNQTLKVDWHQELNNEMTHNKLIDECESSVNVVAKIDMLPFMGTQECEWEASSGDTWTFRLLHGRLRLCVRLAHRYDNASRSRVRADTAVLGVTLDTLHRDKKNPLAVVCVQFARDAMRYFINRQCSRAADVPALLRRCAAVARVALRWGRAMHEARMHLAYTLTPTGHLALKVANIPLRSVWEVTMRLELVVEDPRSSPWPRARDVTVARVVAESDVPPEVVARLLDPLAHDWGHVPNTVWKIFKYLKNKRRDETMLLGF